MWATIHRIVTVSPFNFRMVLKSYKRLSILSESEYRMRTRSYR